MGQSRTARKLHPRPARKRPPRKREKPVTSGNNEVRKWLFNGLLQGLMPRLGQLIIDGAWPWIIRGAGWIAGMLATWLFSESVWCGIC